jgi:hypothetical protein
MSFTIDDVVSAIKVGDAGRMSKYFDSRVEITLHDKTNAYSRSQAEMILRDFFSGAEINAFRIMHRGNSNDSEYCVGNLSTKSGVFRTTIFMKIRGDKKLLHEIRFENDQR